MATPERNHESTEPRDNGAAGRTSGTTLPYTQPLLDDLQKLVADLQAENKWLRYQLAIRIFPPEMSPSFDPAEYVPFDWDEVEKEMRAVERE